MERKDSTTIHEQTRPANPKKLKMKEIEWPYQLTADIKKSPKNKIAFLSGEERKYYPENPGHSKLGVMESMGQADTSVPNPSYYPPRLGVNKPISLKGYGIDHLLTPRFPKRNKRNKLGPEPGTYQTVHMYTARPSLTDIKNPILLQQCKVAFGSHLSVPRFGIDDHNNAPGPGSYNWDICGGCAKVKSADCFSGPRCIIPTVTTICSYIEGERCHECGEEQRFDYYRTTSKVFYPKAKKIGRPVFIILCRKCFCKATNGHIPELTKKFLILFGKARHCSYKHDHQGIPNILTKAFPAQLAKLRRKEVVLAKYFTDFCPPEIN